MMKRIAVWCFFILSFAIACEDDEPTSLETPIGVEYLPLQLGQEAVYQIDTIRYNDFTGRVDTIRLQLRELVSDSLLDAEGREAFEVEIYQRANDTLNWRLIRVVRKTMTIARYELLDNNQKTVPLVFPVKDGKEWDANSLNATDALEYSYSEVNEPFLLDAVTYDSTLTVSQLDEENRIEKRFEEEKYAIGRGMIYRKHIDIRTDFDDNILSGFEVTIRLIQFSN